MGPSGSSTYNQYFERWYQNLNYAASQNSALEFDLWLFYNSVPSSSPIVANIIGIDFDIGLGTVTSTSQVLVSSCPLDYTDSGGAVIKAFYKYHARTLFTHNWPTEIRTRLHSGLSVDSKTSSFGFRNFQYYIDGTVTSSTLIFLASFPCAPGSYWTGTACAACSAGTSCGACTAAAPSQCTICKNGAYDYGNANCKATCPLPFQATTSNGYPYTCQPTCPTTFFWYYNTCTSTCPPPLISSTDSNGLKICSNPCYYNDATLAYVSSWMYPDQTCLSTCPSPLITNSPGLCDNPCPNVNDYVFPNGTCTSQCPSLLAKSIVRGNNFCGSPCSGQYIYYDGSCFSDCVAPMVQRDESTIKFCVSPCSNPQYYWYEVDQKCFPTCADPYEPQQLYNLKICYLSGNLNAQQVQETKAMVASLTGANKAGAAGSKASASLSSTSPALAFLAGQVSLLFSLRYINVGSPDKVKLMFKLQGASPFSLSFDFNIPGGVERNLVERSPPAIFEEYEVPSNFLENSWDTLMTLSLTLLSILVLSEVMKMMKGKCGAVSSIVGGVLSFLKWNIPLMIFCSSFGDMYFFASLQFHSGSYGSTAWEMISFILAILMILIGLVIVLLPVKIAKDMLKDENSKKEGEEKWKNFELLFGGQKRTSIVSFCYMAFYLGVTIISNVIIANLYAYPLCEALLITMISIVMFLFLVIQRPLREVKMFIQVIVNQLLLVIVNVCVVILAIMDELEITREDIRDKVGQGITMIFFCSMASGLAFVVIEVLFTLFYLYKFLKKFKAEHGTLAPKRIFHALFFGNKEAAAPMDKKFSGKFDIERKGTHRQSTDLSLGGGKVCLQSLRKGKNPRKNPLNMSYLDSNTSGIDLIQNQTSDYSFDLSVQPDLSLSKPAKSKLSSQQRKNMLKNANHRVLNMKSDYPLEILKHLQFRPAKDVVASVQQNNMLRSPFEKNEMLKARENIPKQKRKTKQTASQSQSPSKSRSPNRSNPQKRKDGKGRLIKNSENLF